MRRVLVAVLTCLVASGLALPGTRAAGEDRALRDVTGTVEDVRRTTGDDGAIWLDVTLRTDDGETVDVRIAPVEVLELNEFRLDAGDRARLRVFADERPAGVSRIRNVSSGQTLRLRCLRGAPIWTLREPARSGPAREPGGRRPGRGPS